MLIKNNPEEFASYLEDTSNLKGSADVLYIPETTKEVRDIARSCSGNMTPLTCSGARTGTTGGCVPINGAILSMERLNHIHGIDPRKKTARVGAGLPLADLEAALNGYGLTFRAKPTESLAFVGGAASTNASGVRGFRYGSIRKHILRLWVVLSDGTLLDIKRGEFTSRGREFSFSLSGRDFRFTVPTYSVPPVKSQTGYFVKDNMDLIDLFIGSEGTLGIITGLELTVMPLPESSFDGVVFFGTEEEGLDFAAVIKDWRKKGLLLPTSLEFLDSRSLDFLREEYPDTPSAGSAVYFEQEIERGNADDSMRIWAEIIETSGQDLGNVWLGDSNAQRKRIADFRHALPQKINEFLRAHGVTKVATDIAVPDSHFRSMYSFYMETARKTGVHFVNFGHIGENHLHFNFLPRTKEEHRKANAAIKAFIKKAVHIGGTVSAEHGIGKLKKPYLEMMYGPDHIREMAELKRYLDRRLILGKGNLFDTPRS